MTLQAIAVHVIMTQCACPCLSCMVAVQRRFPRRCRHAGTPSPAKPPASRSPTWSIERKLQQLSPFATPTSTKQTPGPRSSAQRYTVQSPSAPSRKASPGPLSLPKDNAKGRGISPASQAAKPAAAALDGTAGHPRPSSSPPEGRPTQMKDSAHGRRTSSVGSPGQGSLMQRQEARSGHCSPSSSGPLGAHARNAPQLKDCSSAQPGSAISHCKGLLSEVSGAQPRSSKDEHTSMAAAAALATLALSPHRPSSTHSSPCLSMRGESQLTENLHFAQSQRAFVIPTDLPKRLCCCSACIACPYTSTKQLELCQSNHILTTYLYLQSYSSSIALCRECGTSARECAEASHAAAGP